jgi:hypothetical protein
MDNKFDVWRLAHLSLALVRPGPARRTGHRATCLPARQVPYKLPRLSAWPFITLQVSGGFSLLSLPARQASLTGVLRSSSVPTSLTQQIYCNRLVDLLVYEITQLQPKKVYDSLANLFFIYSHLPAISFPKVLNFGTFSLNCKKSQTLGHPQKLKTMIQLKNGN